MKKQEAEKLVECPACCDGLIYPGATVGMWAGLVPWGEDIWPRTCDLCKGTGEMAESAAAEWDDAQAALYEEVV